MLTILLFFFFRLISDFVESIYAFGLLGVEIPPEIACVLFFLAPLVIWLLPRLFTGRSSLMPLAWIILVTGALSPVVDTRTRLYATGVGVAAFLLFLPAFLFHQARRRTPAALNAAIALPASLTLSILLRAWASGTDPANHLFGQVLIGLLALIGLRQSLRIKPASSKENGAAQAGSFGRLALLALGLNSALALLYFAFTSPAVMARWAEADYIALLAVLLLAIGLYAALWRLRGQQMLAILRWLLVGWNILFFAALGWALFSNQIMFPADPAAYPLYEPPASSYGQAALYLMVLLSPVVLLDFSLYSEEITRLHPSMRRLGAAFTLGGIFLLLAVLAQVFTTVYDYIPVVGPAFRDRFWLVFAVLGLVMALPALGLPPRLSRATAQGLKAPASLPVLVSLGALFALALAYFDTAAPADPPAPVDTLKVLTFNIQQSYGGDGQRALTRQLELIRQLNPDIIGLQETDTARISGGNTDLVRYFADELDLYSYYGPKTVTGTFGVALLSRLPLENPRTFYMYSEGEQTTTIKADIRIGEAVYHVFVTHLGNGGPLVQQQALLQETSAFPDHVIAMGDFNFRPGTEQYTQTVALLEDSWLLRWPTGVDEAGFDPADRIDHIFLSPGIEVREAQYLDRLESDHPAYLLELKP